MVLIILHENEESLKVSCLNVIGNESASSYSLIIEVETIGDCYLAVTGLPEERHDHADAIALYAQECLDFLNKTCSGKLASTLGTQDLKGRCGIHSGPVVAGILRGDK